ncbi:MAG: hypothetical protein NC328_05120 [Muribaculum sp.]|nr:hypothetical protein [Muribaculum sp.]
MRQRHAGFMEIVKDYSSFDNFLYEREGLMTLFGTEVSAGFERVDLRIQIDYIDYEEYTVIMGKDGHLTMSPEVWWQNECCANEHTNIFTGESVYDEDEDKCFPPVSAFDTPQ